jgi:hypothetical protein
MLLDFVKRLSEIVSGKGIVLTWRFGRETKVRRIRDLSTFPPVE